MEKPPSVVEATLVPLCMVDGLGRPTAVCEVYGSQQNATCGLSNNPASGFKTTYVYATDTTAGNALKTTVTQGAQTRIFETDWLGRTTSVMQPESGTSTYSYAYSTAAGLGLAVTRVSPQANQTGSAQTTTTSQYDALGRLVTVNYSDGTPNRTFAYDTNTYWTQVGSNLKGRLAATGGGANLPSWNGSSIGYDTMGRVTQMWQCGPATCGTSNQAARPLTFAYDWVGDLTQTSDAANGTVKYGRSTAGEVTSITNQTYTNLPQNPPNLVSNVVNGPNGPVSYTLGNGLNVLLQYDGLGRLYGRFVCNGPATASCSGGTQVYGTNGAGNGSQMAGQADTVLNQQVNFGYDAFNRLTSRTVVAGTAQNYTYAYDQYGNRMTQTPLNGGYSFNATINAANNHITNSGYAYDAAGNLTNDSVHTYTYDAEGNITEVDGGSTAQYTYDVFNRRIHAETASGTVEYIYDYAGKRISTWPSPANNSASEGRIYWDGQLLGYRSSDGSTYFDHQEVRGTERMRTNYAGSVAATYASLPWGDGYTPTVNNSAGDKDNLHFAELEHDPETNTEHAQYRNYASAQGRWLTPDPYMGSYDFTNPQSFNRYTYVLNNPVGLVDPSGLYCEYEDDADDGVLEGVDYNSSPGECSSTGGNWFADGSWSTDCTGNLAVCYTEAVAIEEGVTGSGGGGGGSGSPGVGPAHLATLSAPSNLPTPTKLKLTIPGTNYCGPGGSGTPTNQVDNACAAHDTCYGKAGAQWFNNVLGVGGANMQSAIQTCNAQLCSSIHNIVNGPTTLFEGLQAPLVETAFGCAP